MNKSTRQLRLFWNGLALREKRMLSGVGVLLAGLLTWLILVQPALKKIDYWQAETPKLRAQAEALQVLLQGVAAPRQADEASLRQTLDSAGLQGHYQLQALYQTGQFNHDLAIIDLGLPGMGGLDLIRLDRRRQHRVRCRPGARGNHRPGGQLRQPAGCG